MPLVTSPSKPIFVEEHAIITLTAAREHGNLLVNGQVLPWKSLTPASPFIESWQDNEISINVYDWVGCLHLTSGNGILEQVVYVYPSKLATSAEEAFDALSRLIDSLPEPDAQLGFPTELVPLTDQLNLQRLTLADIEQVASQSWHLTRQWERLPRWIEGRQRRIVRGGSVPDRVDWALTLEEWGRGRFPNHVARDLPKAVQPAGASALRQLWQTIGELATTLPNGSELTKSAQQMLSRLPTTKALASGKDPISRRALVLVEQLTRMGRQSTLLPTGHIRMPELYEYWVQVSVLRALEATDGQFSRNGQGLYVGTFRGPGVTVTLNPRLDFYGVGQGRQFLMPDLLIIFDSGETVVADVKYRPLNHLPTEQIREVNRQMLTYMGLTHAATGVVLWPALPGEEIREEPLPSGRARLLRMRCHPLDSPADLARRLQTLNPSGVL